MGQHQNATKFVKRSVGKMENSHDHKPKIGEVFTRTSDLFAPSNMFHERNY